MATATTQHLLLSPAELAYLHTSLSLGPPVRPDGRTASQFRPLMAETGVLPGANGSARVCFADGTEAIVGVKAEVEKQTRSTAAPYSEYFYENKELRRRDRRGGKGKGNGGGKSESEGLVEEEEEEGEADMGKALGSNDWVDISVEIPGYRDDDSNTVFLSSMLSEALLADGEFTKKLCINRRFHWKVYIDVSFSFFFFLLFAYIFFFSFFLHEANVLYVFRSSSYPHHYHTRCPSSV